jgi:hypothetical protein
LGNYRSGLMQRPVIPVIDPYPPKPADMLGSTQ